MSTRGFSAGEWLDRRRFLKLTTAAAAAGAAGGCATNPVTGRNQLMFVSESGEVGLDQQNSPHQFSADYGAVQDAALGAYMNDVGLEIASHTHRPKMPYSFRAVNASYVNAYAFPGGSIAVTRGILVNLSNEAELGALLGHELGHVNARHTAQQMTKGILAETVIAGVGVYLAKEKEKYAALATGLGGVGAGLLLARYSRDNEREADALGMEYLVRSNYSPNGMVSLMAMLRKEQRRQPSALDTMFSTHPMSEERYQTAVGRVSSNYAKAVGYPVHRERYMDRTASLQRIKPALLELQKGDAGMMEKKFGEAESHYAAALRLAPDDYVGLLGMAKCLTAVNRAADARRFAQRAHEVYPQEPQALHVAGMTAIAQRHFDEALSDFSQYERALPGNPNTAFFKGLAFDGMGRKPEATREYRRYRSVAPEGEFSTFTAQRLTEWGQVPTE